MVELDVPAMVHVSASCNPNFHATGAHYINADTTAFMQFIEGDLFRDFPTLRFIIPHGGGAVPYHWGRYRGLADMLKRPPLEEHVMRNVFFDTCVYHQPGIDLLVRVIDIGNILFGSEMVGAVRGIDPRTGHYFDDTGATSTRSPYPPPTRSASSRATRGGCSRASTHCSRSGNCECGAEHPSRGCALARGRGLRALHDGHGLAAVSSRAAAPALRAAAGRGGRALPRVRTRRALSLRRRSASTRPVTRRRTKLWGLRDYLGFDRNVIVQATCHGADNRALVDALRPPRDGPAGSRPWRPSVTDARARRARCRRGARRALQLRRRLVDTTPREVLLQIARRVAPLGWHVVIYFEAAELPELYDFFASLPTTVVVDHMGRPDVTRPSTAPSSSSSSGSMREHPNIWSKVSCPDRLSRSGCPGLRRRGALRAAAGGDFPGPGAVGDGLAAPEPEVPHAR